MLPLTIPVTVQQGQNISTVTPAQVDIQTKKQHLLRYYRTPVEAARSVLRQVIVSQRISRQS